MHKRLRNAGFTRRRFHTGDVELDYIEGPAGGEPLVLIHGQSVTWEEYTFLAPLLATRFHVYAVTLRGHGTSSWTPGQYSFEALGEDMTLFLREVVGRPAVVVGNSSGGVLTAWLAAYSPAWVSSIVLEDPPLFRCDAENLRSTAVYDTWLAFSRMAEPGGGGYARFFTDHVVPMAKSVSDVMEGPNPPAPVAAVVGRIIAAKQALNPGRPVDFRFLPPQARIMMRGTSQFDGTFSRAFVDGTMGAGLDHAEMLALIEQPTLFLHARWLMHQGRLLGALDDEDVARVQSLVGGPWTYVRMDCGHAIALDAPEQEAAEIVQWHASLSSQGT